MYLISKEKKQYKANLHSHSTCSDGKKTPQELKKMYKEHGYSILAITDHEIPKNHSYLNDSEFLTITGYEAYIRRREDSRYDPYEKEIHLNLFAKDPENETIIGYESKYCHYMSLEEQKKYKKAGPKRPREYNTEYINEFIKEAKDNGYIVTYNHAWWSGESEADILSYDGYFSMEMCNYSSYVMSHLEYNAALYDKMLLAGKRVYCHSADDNHNSAPEDSKGYDSFGGFTMIMPEEFTYDSVMEAMQKGEMYSSMGPAFNEISIEGNKIHIECSEVDRIMLFTGSKSPQRKYAPKGGVITCADFEIDDRAKFVRVSIVDKYGKFADTRGFFRDELDF